MRRSRLTAALLALPLAMSTLAFDNGDTCRHVDPDAIAGSGDEYELCTVQTYFHRATTHATNAGFVAPQHGLATFDTTEPAGSVATGNGGGYVATQALGNDEGLTEVVFTGEVTGVVDVVDVDLHILASNEDAVLGGQTVTVELMIGDEVYEVASEVSLPTREAPAANAARQIDFAFTGLASQFSDLAYDTVRDVTLSVRSTFTDAAVVFAFDTTEVPGGISFNPATVDPSATRMN